MKCIYRYETISIKRQDNNIITTAIISITPPIEMNFISLNLKGLNKRRKIMLFNFFNNDIFLIN